MKIVVITATFPPLTCGVGDYTCFLVEHLTKSADVTVLTTHHVRTRTPDGVTVLNAFHGLDPKSVVPLLTQVESLAPDVVLVQYDPYSYGARYAFNPYLPYLTVQLRRRLKSARIGVVVHETYASPTNLKRAVMSTWQRSQLFVLGSAAHVVFFPVAPWVKKFARWFPGKRLVHLPVGNNIPRIAADRREARTALNLPQDALILGFFGRAIPDPDARWFREAVEAAGASGRPVFLLHVGVGEAPAKALFGHLPGHVAGLQPAAQVSSYLAATDIGLAPFPDGISSRRTSAIATLAHAVPLVTSSGSATDELFHREDRKSLFLVGNDQRGFPEAVRELAASVELRAALGKAGEHFVAREFAWNVIASRLLEAVASLH